MTPVERAAKLYDQVVMPRTFREDLEAHLINGYVHSTPELFVMGRAIDRNADPDLIDDPWHTFQEQNTWLVYIFSGLVKTVLQFLPYPLQYVAFQRAKVPARGLKFYETQKLILKCNSSNSFFNGYSDGAPQ